MEKSILEFNKQFEFEPEIQNSEFLKDFDHVILCGMGGSHLAADLIKTIKPGIDLYVHKDYDLPPYEEDFLNRGLLIACSYSGNTEETLSFFKKAYKKELQVSAISTGGELLKEAEENNLPFVKIPNTGIQPRQADGYLALAILKLMGDEETISSWGLLLDKLKPESLKKIGEGIAEEIGDKTAIIYSSTQNLHISYNWKITLNETAKIPAFYNIFPELNHNEIQGFENMADRFHIILLEDSEDLEQIQDRMRITREVLEEKGLSFSDVKLSGNSREEKVFNSIILADWVALTLANSRDIDPEQVPIIEEFKKLNSK
jgi:glucose/mannose-6-phosphate isomerase